MLPELQEFLSGRVAVLYVDELAADRKFVFYKGTAYKRVLTGDHKIVDTEVDAQEEFKEEAVHARELQPVAGMSEALRNDLNPGDTNPGDTLRDLSELITQVTNRFEIFYSGSITDEADQDKILIREKQPTQASNGVWVKAYGLVNGVGQLVKAPDGNFENWEKQHMASSDARR